MALLLAAIFAYVYFSQRHTALPVSSQPAALASPSAAPDKLFHCGSRTKCAQMTSCAEATYFLDHCPGATMDGNHDGVPCEGQWCGAGHEGWP
ncbi:MAG: excalibur calcium-binding domain-containing protein [Rhodanobacter sp.]